MIFGPWGDCVSRRLDHGLKLYVIRGGPVSSRLTSEFSDSKLPVADENMKLNVKIGLAQDDMPLPLLHQSMDHLLC